MSQHDGKLCINCHYWEGRYCHSEPPHATHGFPTTREDEWCGRWQMEAPNRRREREAETLKDLA